MNIQRFTAATSREALAKARQTFGEGTLILSNRPTEHGVEVVATAEDALAMLDRNADDQARKQQSSARQGTAPSYQEVASKVEDDAEQLAMSTLSFQDYVRERMLRRRHEATQNQTPATTLPPPVVSPPLPILKRIPMDVEAAMPPKAVSARKPPSFTAAPSIPKNMM
jgi:flagellar biosynthesis protein FlhF